MKKNLDADDAILLHWQICYTETLLFEHSAGIQYTLVLLIENNLGITRESERILNIFTHRHQGRVSDTNVSLLRGKRLSDIDLNHK